MRRRTLFLGTAAVASGLVHLPGEDDSAQAQAPDIRFDVGWLRAHARDLAKQSYKAPETSLPSALKDLDYDQYRHIRFDRRRALWSQEKLPFELQPFHRGFLYTQKIELFQVEGGKATPIAFSPDQFDYGPLERPPNDPDIGFAGFKLTGPLNRDDHFDEIISFLGASYFRALGKGHIYGLSARGLAIRTADSRGEEFPVFRAFWIEKPRPNVRTAIIYALLDSPSATGAYRFTVRPGEDTVVDVECAIYPRSEMNAVGVAPGTSMYFFGPNDRQGVDDYRPAVHDSDGLLISTGRGEQLWRPLANPRDLQISGFGDANPRGFGLMQRQRSFDAYLDLEASYHRRPSLWVEPVGDWGEGVVQLVEIPTQTEIHDNIVAFWKPKDPWKAGGEYGMTYRLHWCDEWPGNQGLAQFTSTRIGHGSGGTNRRFVLDIAGGKLPKGATGEGMTLDLTCGPGKISNQSMGANTETGGIRIAFELEPGDAQSVELRARLMSADGPVTETWLYRWTP